ncbi:PilZ domain-containing protein [Dongia sp.]|uniref:PilZ domain-containing protein n=1 Tax=Dongia sp. TaxID=1977262 RepID=UPI0035ADE31D
MSDDDRIDHRRHRRFRYDGTAMLVFDDSDHRRTLAITNYRNISQGGACILTPDVKGFAAGDRMYLMPERYRRKREAVVVDLGAGRLHLEIPSAQALSEFEVAEILEQINRVNKAE